MTDLGITTAIQSSSTAAFGCSRDTEKVRRPSIIGRTGTISGNTETHNLDARSGSWESANWENGGVFNCAWRPGNISFQNGIMSIVLKKEIAGKYPYTSGEYRSTKEYGYGSYETRMKAASGNGLVTSFFVYSGIYGTSNHHEIDVEIFGKNPRQVQLNYYVGGKEGKKVVLDLPFDASQGFHNYGFIWKKDSVEWFVDGISVYKAEGIVPSRPGKIMANLWPGTKEVSEWLGGIYDGNGATALYDWIKATTNP